jgi:dTDP-glucose pyrophosphorylase
MKNWKDALIGPNATLREALDTIDRAGCQLAMVIDEEGRMLGTLSDGDARRALLRGISLDDRVDAVMHREPTCANAADGRQAILDAIRQVGVHQIPLVDERGVVVGLSTVDDFLNLPDRPNWVVIMAGGMGSRLQELTRETPKPMLKVGPRPLLESIVRSYADQGFKRFFLAVNYKAEQIERHFGDGSALGVQITYLREDQRLGTAGALSMLPERPAAPIIVTNADLLTKEDYASMVESHQASGADATVAVREYEMQIPFGVVREQNARIEAIEEKPKRRFLVSAGICVLSPDALDVVPHRTYFDMPSLFEALIARGGFARCHAIDGYWLDIGRLPDYEQANTDFNEVFR